MTKQKTRKELKEEVRVDNIVLLILVGFLILFLIIGVIVVLGNIKLKQQLSKCQEEAGLFEDREGWHPVLAYKCGNESIKQVIANVEGIIVWDYNINKGCEVLWCDDCEVIE